jgi:xanthine dehydrogenase accessory factor
MMGSKAEVNRIFKNIGFNPETSEKRIYAPIGLPINSQTPDEIAINIAADIIEITRVR